MEKLEEVLVDNSTLIENIDNVVLYFRQQNFDRGIRRFELIINTIEKVLANYETILCINAFDTNYSKEAFLNLLPSILLAQENRDYVLLSDLLELQLRPFVIKIQEWIICELNYVPCNADEEINVKKVKEYDERLFTQLQTTVKSNIQFQCEYTASGLYTVKCMNKGKEFYLHSNNNPHYEGALMANTWYSEDKHKYMIYGLGLGYHICQLCQIDNYIQVDVYESNLEIIKLAVNYGVLERCLQSGQVRIHYDPEYKDLANMLARLDEDTEFVVHAPSQRLIEENSINERMEEYFLHYHSVKNQKGILKGNFRFNVNHYDAYVDDLLPLWKDKDVFIIAAGPSLDYNYQELKKVGTDSIVLATGTVYRKLMAAGIKPDYVIITDGNARVIGQIGGLEQEEVPMLLLSTAYKEFSRMYQGKKYLICQEGFTLAEEYAKDKGYHLYQTGGSVSTTALDVAISLHAKRVIFVGLDLAYPNNLVHAEGTTRRHLTDDDELKVIKDINGNPVKTNKHLDLYRRWMEERISESTNEIEFIDATEGGAYVKGTILMKLKDVIG